jgi:hypothetical protein
MRCSTAALAVTVAIAATACGGDASREEARKPKAVTSEFPLIVTSSTPGSGGFIEVPKDKDRDQVDELGYAVPEIKQVPGTGQSIFSGAQRDAYLRAKAACGKEPRRAVARGLGLDSGSRVAIASAYAARQRLRLWQAAFEGCAVGVRP